MSIGNPGIYRGIAICEAGGTAPINVYNLTVSESMVFSETISEKKVADGQIVQTFIDTEASVELFDEKVLEDPRIGKNGSAASPSALIFLAAKGARSKLFNNVRIAGERTFGRSRSSVMLKITYKSAAQGVVISSEWTLYSLLQTGEVIKDRDLTFSVKDRNLTYNFNASI